MYFPKKNISKIKTYCIYSQLINNRTQVITNAHEDIMPLAEASMFYRLRWQIELIFKTWKSLASIDKVKKIKKERFECQLYARLIWILLNWKIYQAIDYCIKKLAPKEGCSVQKFFNMVNK